MSRFQVLLAGRSEREEFQPVKISLNWVARVEEVPDLRKGSMLLQKGDFLPDLILLVQSYPGEFSASQVDLLRRAAPLAPIGVVLGPWCEGETRSGKPLPGVWRVYWHQWLVRGRLQIERFLQGECPLWGLPTTSIDEERLLATPLPLPKKRQGPIGICSASPDSAQGMCIGLQAWGYETHWIRLRVAVERPFRRDPEEGQPPIPRPIFPHVEQGKGEQNLLEGQPPIPRPVFPGSPIAQYGPEGALQFLEQSAIAELRAIVFDATDATGQEALWLREFAARRGQWRIVLLVDFPRPELWERVRLWGVQAILGKPFVLGDLVGCLEQLENDETSALASG